MKGIARTRRRRRDFLRTALYGAAGVTLCRQALGQYHATDLTVHDLGENLIEIIGAGANVIVLAADHGLLLIDGGLAERSAELLGLVRDRWPGRPILSLFNTNWSWEHTGSNLALGAGGTKIIAHENTKLWLGAKFTIGWQNRVHEPYPREALPSETFYTSESTMFGAEEVRYGHFAQAHTDGDLYVFLPARNVLVVSDLLSVGTYPIVDSATGGWLGGMANAAQALLEIADERTQIVPAIGPVQNRADLERYQAMCVTLKDRIGGMIKSGMSLAEVIAAQPTKEYDAQWGESALFLELAYKGLWGHIRELGGVL
jgi:glyoxylase-like metal-dependent hydrolase (beta-lactamase superfamily II)